MDTIIPQAVFPVVVPGGRRATQSQGFVPVTHLGVDLMCPRLPTDPPYRDADPRGTRGWYVPEGTYIVSMWAGLVVYAKRADNGLRVRLAHAEPMWPRVASTLYLHLASLDVQVGQLVEAGQRLGLMGGDPTSADVHHTVHLHCETRDDGGIARDPWQYLKGARYLV